MSQSLYVFDMDETLVNGDSTMIWHQFLVDQGIVRDPHFLQQDQAMMALYQAEKLDIQAYIDFAMTPLKQIPIKDIEALVEQCVTTRLFPKIFPEAKTLITRLNARHTPLLIISASVSFIVEKIAQCLQIPNALGINLHQYGEYYTSQIEGIPSFREGKISCLNTWINQQPQSFSDIHFYTDSINDLPLCLLADYVYLINPCDQLKQQAIHQQDWTTYSWGQA